MIRRRAGHVGRAFLIAALVVVVTAIVGAPTAKAAPPGNNGTVKVDDGEFNNGNANDPHVGCEFGIEWFGFDTGTRTTTVTFDAQAPTKGGTLLTDTFQFQGSGPGNTKDADKLYDLSDELKNITPHPNQGWHVKVTVETDGSQGADKKHKTFWVKGCFDPDVDIATCAGPGGTDGITVTIKNNDVAQDITIDQDGSSQVVSFDAGQTKSIDLPHTGATTITISSITGDIVKEIKAPDCTNEPEVGSITLEKVLAGDAAPPSSTDFTFTISCEDSNATLDQGSPIQISPDDGAVTVASNVLTNTTCTITETGTNGATSVAYGVNGNSSGANGTVEVTPTSSTPVAVVAHNTFDPAPECEVDCGPPPPPPCQVNCTPPPPQEHFGSITLDKVLSGTGAPSNDPTFSFTVSCEDSDATVQTPVSIKASDPATTVASSVSFGTSCTITETNTNGATSVSYTVNGSPASSTNSVVVTPTDTNAVAVVADNDFVAPPEVGGTTQNPPDEVLGEVLERPALARTGFADTTRLLVWAACLMVAGLLLTGWSKKAQAPTTRMWVIESADGSIRKRVRRF